VNCLFQALFVRLSGATDCEQARYLPYLKVENRLLRDEFSQRISVNPRATTAAPVWQIRRPDHPGVDHYVYFNASWGVDLYRYAAREVNILRRCV
jgi:hypothetical protein